MSLPRGTQLGSCEILDLLGKGGMGEVYRGRDTRLGREVAVKALPDAFAHDADRLARFEREAQVLASLNHPNIAIIHELKEVDGAQYLILELVEGTTLAERIASGAVPLNEALDIATQIAEALDTAHARGVVHRDLKPANVKITPEGRVKVLDFGLAKVFERGDGSPKAGDPSPTFSPTLSAMQTLGGMILGTAAYMSPEQARGKSVDRRADVWAFGCIVFEMLTGRQTFPNGETASDTLAGVLTREPDWPALPASTPPKIRALIERCLRKDPQRRLRDMGDARIEIEDARAEPAPPTLATDRRARTWPWIVATAVLCVAAIALGIAYVRRAPAEASAIRFTISPPDRVTFVTQTAFQSISPDGRRLTFVARDTENHQLLWVRAIDSLAAQPLRGTEGASGLIWSPDSRFIGFVAQGKLKKVDASGAPPQTLCDVPPGVSAAGAWSPDGVILLANLQGPLLRVSSAGGTPVPALELDASRQEVSQRGAHFLPDGRHFLYHSFSSQGDPAIAVGSLDSKATHVVLRERNSGGPYAPPGYILFVRDRTLMAQPFDPGAQKVTAEAFPIAEDVESGVTGPPTVSVSQTGTLTYRTGTNVGASQLLWFDRSGKPLDLAGPPPAPYGSLDLSPDGKRVVVNRLDETGANNRTANLWLFDWTRGIPTRLTFEAALDQAPVWSPDGTRVAFRSNRDGSSNLYQKVSSGAGADELLAKSSSSESAAPSQWSFDGRFIVYTATPAGGRQAGSPNNDIWVLPTFGDRKPTPFLQTKSNELHGQLSPNGRWMAYTSNESGTYQVYVQPFPATGAKWQVSTSGGSHPRWNPNGKELFEVSTDGKLMAVAVRTGGPSFEADAPSALFQAPLAPNVIVGTQIFNVYSVSPDGQRFLMISPSQDRAAAPITVVVNWAAGLRK